ncbi:YfiT family bacillithiol transferase [Pontibacter locisalis]|uniref:YfiT family bacillithiol transferase n=1 Tax=Pontibacter locisalis TaxID=1719035 RepID=A0ABW5IJ51_9BACT
MSDEELEQLRYPIGKFNASQPITQEAVEQFILSIGQLPEKLQQMVAKLTPEQFNTPYRPDGWTVRQVVHHLPDSHLNGYARHKLALTEEVPTIKTYNEGEWAELLDSTQGDPGISISLLAALHLRWVLLLKTLTPEQLDRKLNHPLSGECSIRQSIGIYAWHGEHHLAQIQALINRKNWKAAEQET